MGVSGGDNSTARACRAQTPGRVQYWGHGLDCASNTDVEWSSWSPKQPRGTEKPYAHPRPAELAPPRSKPGVKPLQVPIGDERTRTDPIVLYDWVLAV